MREGSGLKRSPAGSSQRGIRLRPCLPGCELTAWRPRFVRGLYMPTPIEEEPESTIGKRPDRLKRSEPEQGRTRSGTALRRDERDETESESKLTAPKRGKPPTGRGEE
jgi:hypothetical protein